MTSLEIARSLVKGPIVAGGWGGVPRKLQRLLSLIGYGSTGGVCGLSLTARKILFIGRQTCSLYLVLWLCRAGSRGGHPSWKAYQLPNLFYHSSLPLSTGTGRLARRWWWVWLEGPPKWGPKNGLAHAKSIPLEITLDFMMTFQKCIIRIWQTFWLVGEVRQTRLLGYLVCLG